MRALTVWQPWASLIAECVKTIETRSKPTHYRGPLLIHAGKSTQCRRRGGLQVGDYKVRPFGTTGMALEGPGLPRFRSTPRLQGYWLPLGAVVAVADLVDVVPIVDDCGTDMNAPEHLCTPAGSLLHHRPESAPFAYSETEADKSDQLPCGDFTPGRYAWLLGNVRKIDPVPAKGRQRLWIPDDDVVRQVGEQMAAAEGVTA